MNKRIKLIIILAAVFAGGLAAALIAYNKLSGQVSGGMIDNYAQGETVSVPGASAEKKTDQETAPDFTMLDMDGNEVKLSDHKGKPVILNFWASWCPPCRSEMPGFENVYKEKGSDIDIMMVDLTDGFREDVLSSKEIIENSGYSFPVYFDSKGDGAKAYGVISIPSTFFINADGSLMGTHMGAMSEAQPRDYAEALISQE